MPQSAGDGTLLTVEDVAARLQVHPKTVYRLLDSGALRGVKVGRVWRVPAAEILRHMAQPVVSDDLPPGWTEVLEGALFAAAVVDPATGAILVANPAFAALYRCAPRDLAGRQLVELFAPEARAAATEQLGRAYEDARYVIDAQHLRGDGSRFPAFTSMLAITASDRRARLRVAIVMDISAYRRAEVALDENREWLAGVIETNAEGILIFDRDGRYVLTNAAMEQIFGVPRASFLGGRYDEPPVRRYTVDGQPLLGDQHAFAEVRRTGASVYGNEGLIERPDGTRTVISANAAPLHDGAGAFAGAVVCITDITARKSVETALQDSEQRYRDLFEHANDIVYTLDMTGRVTAINRRGEEVTGYSRDELFGTKIDAIIVPQYLDMSYQMLGRKVAGSAQTAYEMEIRTKDGRRIALDVSSRLIYHDGQPAGIHGIARDITDRRAEQRAQRMLAETSTILAASLDFDATLASVAQLAVPLLADACVIDLEGADGGLYRAQIANSGPADREARLRELQRSGRVGLVPDHPLMRAFHTGTATLLPDLPAAARGASGSEAIDLSRAAEAGLLSAMYVPLATRGRTLGVLSLGVMAGRPPFNENDLALGEELARRAALAIDNALLYRQAEEAIAVRDQFLSIASHELRTPLTTIKGQIEVGQRRLARDAPRDQIARALELAAGQANRLNRLIGEMLDVSRLAVGRFTISPERISLNDLVERVVESERAGEPPCQIALVLPGDALLVEADPLRLEQVLVNLLQNARKYSSPEAQIRVEVGSAGGAITVAVHDHGIGIPVADLPHIFAPFRRAGNVDSGISGLGLGLYISQEIVRAHGGTLTVTSSPDEGSTFTVSLPWSRLAVAGT